MVQSAFGALPALATACLVSTNQSASALAPVMLNCRQPFTFLPSAGSAVSAAFIAPKTSAWSTGRVGKGQCSETNLRRCPTWRTGVDSDIVLEGSSASA